MSTIDKRKGSLNDETVIENKIYNRTLKLSILNSRNYNNYDIN